MRKILLDGNEVKSLVPESLPMLIHGNEGSGASLYTICLAAKWFSQGYTVLMLCGYPMAEQEFKKQVGTEHSNAKFYTQDKLDEFIIAVKNSSSKDTIIFVKNIELFSEVLFNALVSLKNVIISGDMVNVNFKDKLLVKKFTTEIYFSTLKGKQLPQIEKYHGYIIADDYKGFTSLG